MEEGMDEWMDSGTGRAYPIGRGGWVKGWMDRWRVPGGCADQEILEGVLGGMDGQGKGGEELMDG